MSESTVLSIVPAAVGWRIVTAYTGCDAEDLDAAADEELFAIRPIACFALVEDERGDRDVHPVFPEDFPSYLCIAEGTAADHIGFLGPGEDPDEHYRAEAIRAINRTRSRYAAQKESA